VKAFLRQNSVYLALYLLLVAYLGYVLLNVDKFEIHRFINQHVENGAVSTFFKYITHIGDGVFAMILVFVFLFVNLRKAVFLFLAYISSSLVTTVLKNFFYADYYRPYFLFHFYKREDLNLIDGVEILSNNSFPSGHSTSAFAVFFTLIFMTKNQALKFLYFLTACIAAFSRTYISQHWLVDIYIGSIIGVSFAVLCYFVFYIKPASQKLEITLPQLFATKKKNV
jgi:membrane-associated phospholipid phosphatase